MNLVRLIWCGLYGLLGIIFLIIFFVVKQPDFNKFFGTHYLNILWVFGWSTIGISAGLCNSRDDKTPVVRSYLHYITYFLFVLFIASLAAFVAFLSIINNNLLAFASSALTAIVVGFVGDKLAGKISSLGKF
ncbi:hypothetical protein KJ830_08800 [bacterium]|nr:hypothetical protein [bacterium]